MTPSPPHGSANLSLPENCQPVTWTLEASSKSEQETSPVTFSAISSPESADGLSPCDGPELRQTRLFGPGLAPASHSAESESEKELQTSDTCGLSSGASLRSVVLQSSLESRLRARMAAYGSPEYALTWNHWDMPSGPRICALRASQLPTSDNACTGWVTPSARDWKDTPGTQIEGVNPDGSKRMRLDLLARQVYGLIEGSLPAGTPSPDLLNPAFSRWLMGYPVAWESCADMATRSFPSSQPSLSKRTSRQRASKDLFGD